MLVALISSENAETDLGTLMNMVTVKSWGHAVAYWLRHYATNRKVASSIPDEVIFLKKLPNLSGRTRP
jgi:hypothetical protein